MKEYSIRELREYWISAFGLKDSKIITPKIKKQIEEEIRSFLIERIRQVFQIKYPSLSKIKVQDLVPDASEISIKENWKLCSYNGVPVFRFLLFKTKNGLLRIDFKDYGK